MVRGKILITETNKEELAQLLAQAQGKAWARCFDAEDILSLANEAETKLESLGVAKKYRIGTVVHYSEYASKRAKKWSEDITEVKLKRDKKEWYLIEAVRISRSWKGRINHLYITDEAIAYLAGKLRHLTLEE